MPLATHPFRFTPVFALILVLGGTACVPSEEASVAQDGGPPFAPHLSQDGGGSSRWNGAPDGGSGSPSDGGCLAGRLPARFGRSHVLVGAMMDEDVAASAPFDFRYLYLSGGVFDGTAVCSSCTQGCAAGGQSCSGGACAWWGCWQDVQEPPGAYVRRLVAQAEADGQIPMVTYYEQLHVSGTAEGVAQVAAAQDVAKMRRYFADYRFLLQTLGQHPALVHLEPDLWGYVQQVNANPTQVPAAVATANPTDCANQPNHFAGLARCLLAMTRTYAPRVAVGFHASPWGTSVDVLQNTQPGLDVGAEARKLGDFLLALGAGEADFIALDALDRDSGYYQSLGDDTFWDATNQSLPHFHQAFAWAQALSERVGLPNVWWQLPVGNMSLVDVPSQWKDNRVDYFLTHMGEVAAAHGGAVAFGAGAEGQTTPSTDQGNLVAKTQAYVNAGRMPACR